jgi:hypothetical protein
MADIETVPAFDIMTALANQADTVSRSIERLSAMRRVIDVPALDWIEWLLLFAEAVDYRPDLIVELGRFHGSSTCALTEAATVLGECRVRSYDVDGARAYETRTLPRLRPLVSADWLGRQEIVHKDLTREAPEDMLRGGRRVLLFWDAHESAVARHVLARVAPALATREHLIVVHDVLDARYASVDPGYVTQAGQLTVWRGHLMSDCEELDEIHDFASRNGIRLHTAGRSAWGRCPDSPAAEVVPGAVRGIVGSALDLFDDPRRARFVYFSCGDRTSPRPLVFPPGDDWDRVDAAVAAPADGAVGATSVPLNLADFRPHGGTVTATGDGHVVIVTPPQPWAYAASMRLPARARAGGTSGAVRIRAELLTGGPVGVGVLVADGKSFMDRGLVTASSRPVELFLNLPRLASAGELVVETWDQAASGTVRVESATLIVRDTRPEKGSSVQ